MGKLRDLYHKIENPLDDLKTIEKLVLAYSKALDGFGGFYSKMVRTVDKEHVNMYYPIDANYFYATTFNKWKNSIVSMTKEEFLNHYKKGDYGQDFVKLRNFLKGVPDVTTREEADKILNMQSDDIELEDALDKYSWTSLGEFSGWVHVCSRYLTAKRDSYPHVEHRLYIDTDSLDTYKMANLFIAKCDQHKMPYYFKFSEEGNRDDTMVIYTSTDNLSKYIDILREIKLENPDLGSRLKTPPVLTGKIDGWIGYGSEPDKLPNGDRTSFNEVRSNLIEPIIKNKTLEWIKVNLNTQITVNGQRITIYEHIIRKCFEYIIEGMEKRFNYYADDEKKVANKKGYSYDVNVVKNKLGYSLEMLRSSQFRNKLYQGLKSFLTVSKVISLCGNAELENLEFALNNDKKHKFTNYDMQKIIGYMSVEASRNDKSFLTSIQQEIKSRSRSVGIDENKFCFDISAKKRIAAYEKMHKDPSEGKMDALSVSKPIQRFMLDNKIDINSVERIYGYEIKGSKTARKSDYDFTLTWGNLIYNNRVSGIVSIKDIVGSFGLDHNSSFLSSISMFFNNKDSYGERALKYLNGSMLANINKILNSEDLYDLVEIDGKYYVGGDGNHRIFYLMLVYMTLREQYKDNPGMLAKFDEKFKIKANVRKKSGYDKIDKICYALTKVWNDAIKLTFNVSPPLIAVMKINGRDFKITSEEDFVQRFKEYFLSLNKTSKEYEKLNSLISKYDFYNELIMTDKKVSESKDALDSYSFVNSINPVVTSGFVNLPNGTRISSRDFIKNIVFPHLPKSGVVILSNGTPVSIKQFVEEVVMVDCVQNYHGDFYQFMMDRTRNNVGLITIKTNEEEIKMLPNNIVNLIDKSVLNRRIKQQNGMYMSAKQYIGEIFSPHIPSNGCIMVKDGRKVSIIKFIEKVLFGTLSEVSIDVLNRILFNSTIANDGIVNNNTVLIERNIQEIRHNAWEINNMMRNSGNLSI